MKIICGIFYVSAEEGRANSDVFGLARLLAKRDYQVHLVCLKNGRVRKNGSNKNVYIYPVLNVFSLHRFIIKPLIGVIENIVMIGRIILKSKADIVIASSDFPVLIAVVFLQKIIKKRIVLYCRELSIEKYLRYTQKTSGISKLERKLMSVYINLLRRFRIWAIKKPNYVLSMDLGIREYFFKEFRGEVEIEYMPPVVDVDVFNPFINGRKARGKLKLHDDDLVILYLGALAPYRRIDILVKAFSCVVKEHPNARLMIGGMGKKDHLVRLVKQLNLEEYVLFLSWMPYAQIPELIAASDICVDPYPRSGIEEFQLSLKILEYMAVGKCVIAAKNRGNMQLIQDGFNGMLLTPNSVEDLKCKITQLIIDKKLREKLGKMAWITVKEKHSGIESLKVLEEKLIK